MHTAPAHYRLVAFGGTFNAAHAKSLAARVGFGSGGLMVFSGCRERKGIPLLGWIDRSLRLHGKGAFRRAVDAVGSFRRKQGGD